MRLTIILAMILALPAVAAQPKAPPVSINIRTAGDLAVACSARPVSPGNAALLNFCNGFAQGVVQTERLNPEGSKICPQYEVESSDSSNRADGRLATARQGVPATQHNRGADDRRDQPCALVRAIQWIAGPRNVATTLPTTPNAVLNTNP